MSSEQQRAPSQKPEAASTETTTAIPPSKDAQQAAGALAIQSIATEPAHPELAVGGAAVLVRATHVTFDDGTSALLSAGTYVELESLGPSVACHVHSGHGGKLATIAASALRAEPKMLGIEGAPQDVPDDREYASNRGVLWKGRPTVEDVRQGDLGDCYLMSAMGSIAALDPTAIVRMFSPQTQGAATYQVRLFRRSESGALVPHVETVDRWLPSMKMQHTDAAGKAQGAVFDMTIFGSIGKDALDSRVALWPALVEKAYAQMMGGYDAAGQGGSAVSAMEAMTGVEGHTDAIPANDEQLLAFLRQRMGSVIVAADSIYQQHTKNRRGFSQTAPGQFEATLDPGRKFPPHVVPRSFLVGSQSSSDVDAQRAATAGVSKAELQRGFKLDELDESVPLGADDGQGGVQGDGVSGTIDYLTGKVKVAWSGAKVPSDPALLAASYDWNGLLDENLGVYANHAYMFVGVTADGLVQLRDPVGVDHPRPLTASQFRAMFEHIFSDALRT